jgi:hypothetical protein
VRRPTTVHLQTELLSWRVLIPGAPGLGHLDRDEGRRPVRQQRARHRDQYLLRRNGQLLQPWGRRRGARRTGRLGPSPKRRSWRLQGRGRSWAARAAAWIVRHRWQWVLEADDSSGSRGDAYEERVALWTAATQNETMASRQAPVGCRSTNERSPLARSARSPQSATSATLRAMPVAVAATPSCGR